MIEPGRFEEGEAMLANTPAFERNGAACGAGGAASAPIEIRASVRARA